MLPRKWPGPPPLTSVSSELLRTHLPGSTGPTALHTRRAHPFRLHCVHSLPMLMKLPLKNSPNSSLTSSVISLYPPFPSPSVHLTHAETTHATSPASSQVVVVSSLLNSSLIRGCPHGGTGVCTGPSSLLFALPRDISGGRTSQCVAPLDQRIQRLPTAADVAQVLWCNNTESCIQLLLKGHCSRLSACTPHLGR